MAVKKDQIGDHKEKVLDCFLKIGYKESVFIDNLLTVFKNKGGL
jgi:hypothetical protein